MYIIFTVFHLTKMLIFLSYNGPANFTKDNCTRKSKQEHRDSQKDSCADLNQEKREVNDQDKQRNPRSFKDKFVQGSMHISSQGM